MKYSLLLILTLLVSCTSMQDASVVEIYSLHYDRPAIYFEESLPLGNGQLGALVYGGVAEEHISLNDITLWTGEPELSPWTPEAWRHLDDVRRALDREDYVAANEANQLIEGHKSEIYQPLGFLQLWDLDVSDEVTDNYQRSLCLNDALSTVTYTSAVGTVTRECFVSAPDSVIVLRISTTAPSGLHHRLRLGTLLPHVSSGQGNSLWCEGYAAYSTKPEVGKREWFHYDEKRGIHFRTELRVDAPAENVKIESDSTLLIDGCRSATVILTNVTSYNGPYRNPVAEGRDFRLAVVHRLSNVNNMTYQQLLARHKADVHAFFDRVHLNLGTTPDSIAQMPTDRQLRIYSEAYERSDSLLAQNPDLEELYFQYGRYLLIASSRTDGVPATLQGLWNEQLTPPWSSNYTVNINVEENYWPAEITALTEMHRPLLTWISNLPRSGAITAQNYYAIHTGWCVCHNSDIWCTTNPVGYQQSSPEWACWPLGGAWLTTHLWEHYSFTRDRAALAYHYPIMKGAVAFVRHWLVERNSELITAPSTSPENHFLTPDGVNSCTLYGGTADLAMIRELLIDVRKAALTLGHEKTIWANELAYADTLQLLIDQLHPYRIGRKGNLQEWYYDWEDADPHHRHQSHLFGLYPGHHINAIDSPELMQACARSLEIKGDRTTGWSSGWRVNLQARLGNASDAYHMLRQLLCYVSPSDYRGADRRGGGGTYPNLLDAHPPFQIDGNYGGTAGIAEMLVQSTDEGLVTLLPALPAQWAADGSVSGLRLRGGYEMAMKWHDGRVTSLDIRRLYPTDITLRFQGPGDIESLLNK